MILDSKRLMETFCGIDEAGRGPWAGPVVASVVCLPKKHNLLGLDDSKKLSINKRFELYKKIVSIADVGVGFSSVKEIDQYNILEATFLAMVRAYNHLKTGPTLALIDGNRTPADFPCEAKAIIKGDSRIPAISAASIIAKVTRDYHMKKLAEVYKGYGWEKNFGYGVKYHKEALKLLGITPEHRRSFKPIHNMLC